jgi:hypothetical protein
MYNPFPHHSNLTYSCIALQRVTLGVQGTLRSGSLIFSGVMLSFPPFIPSLTLPPSPPLFLLHTLIMSMLIVWVIRVIMVVHGGLAGIVRSVLKAMLQGVLSVWVLSGFWL